MIAIAVASSLFADDIAHGGIVHKVERFLGCEEAMVIEAIIQASGQST